MFSRTDSFHKALEGSLARLGRSYTDLYQHHFPSRFVSIPELMDHMAGGALTGKYKPGSKPHGVFRRFMKPLSRKGITALIPVLSLLTDIGKLYERTPAQVALRWLVENPVVLPIPGAKNAKQASENAAALTFGLTQEEIEELDKANVNWLD